MAKYVIEDTTLNNTANAIREKTGKTDKITPSNFATEIASIKSGPSVTKGIVINECDEEGYATDMSVVGMTEIPANYFYYGWYKTNCFHKVTSNLHLEDTIEIIGDNAFYYCETLSLTSLPSSLTSIGNKAFYNCVNLSLTSLPSSLTSIGNQSFLGCSILQELTILGPIETIGESAFYGCPYLKKFIFPNVISVPILGAYAFNNTSISNKNGGIYVPDDLVESFKSATNWSGYADYIKPISELEASA